MDNEEKIKELEEKISCITYNYKRYSLSILLTIQSNKFKSYRIQYI